MKVGIIGLPGSGKTTLFHLMTECFDPPDYTRGQKPQMRRVTVHDSRLERLRDDYSPKKYTPAQIDILDFPAVQREGQDRSGIADLLAPAREAQALIVVLRGFRSASVPGGDTIDPVSELEEVRGELLISDLVSVERRMQKLEGKSQRPRFSAEDKHELALLGRVRPHLDAECGISTLALTADEQKVLSGFGFLTGKPLIAIINAGSAEQAAALATDATLARLRELAAREVIAFAVQNEADVLELPEEDRAEFLQEYEIKTYHRDELIAASYRAAGALSFFTTGEDEVRAWTVREGTPAPEAAGCIHTDIQRGFIRAEVVAFADYEKHGGTKGAKDAGVFRLEGKEYLVKDGDVIEFRFSV